MSGSYNLGDNGINGSIDLNKLKSGIRLEDIKDASVKNIFLQFAGENRILDRNEINKLKEYLANSLDTDGDGTITDKESRKAKVFGDNAKILGKEGREQLFKLLKALSEFTTGIDRVISGKNDKNNKNDDVLETVYYSDGREEIVYKDGKKEVITEKGGYKTTTYIDKNGTPTQTIETDKKGNKAFKDGQGNILKKEFITDEGKQIQEFKDGQIYKITTITDSVTSVQTFNDDNTYTMKVTKDGKTEEYVSTTGSNTDDKYVPEKERTVTRKDEQGRQIVEKFVNGKISSQTINERTVEYGYDKDGNIYTKGVIVQNAETIVEIAKKFGVSPEALIKANKDKLHKSGGTYWFKVGAEIVIPRQVEADDLAWETRVSRDEAIAEFNRDWKATHPEPLENVEETEDEQTAADIQTAEKTASIKEEKAKKRANMNSVANQFYEASQKINRENMAKMISLAKNNVNADNVLEFIMAFDKVNGDDGDDIVAAITSAGISSLRVKHEDRKTLLNYLIDTLCKRAIKAGVNEYDVQRLQNNFRASLNAEYRKIGTVDSTNMDTIIKTLVSLINVQENKSTEEYEESSVMASVAYSFKEENKEAQEAFDEARQGEGWITRNASKVRLFSSTTIEELRAVLGDNADKVDWLNNLAKLLKNPPSEEERVRLTKLYEQTYFELFGIEYNPDNITAYEEYYEKCYNASLSKTAGEILSDINGDVGYDNLIAQLKNKLKLDDSTVEALVTQIIEQNPEFEINTDEDKKNLLLAFFEGISAEYDALTNGDTPEEMAQKLESLSRAAFGTNQIGDKVAAFNKDMITTMMASEAAAEILGTIAVSWIPGVGEAAMAKLAVSATKWGTKGVKIVKMANKTKKAFKAATKIQKGTKFSSKLATKAGQAGYAMAATGIATATVDLSDKKSVKDTLSKTLMNMSFAAVGSASSMIAPKLMKSFGIVDRALANEIAEEIINAAGSYGVVTVTGGHYGKEDAFIDFVTGMIISRLSHANSTNASATKPKPTNNPAPKPAPREKGKSPLSDATYNPKGKDDVAPSGAVRGKLSPEKAQAIRNEIDAAINNPNTTPEQLAELRKKLDALGVGNDKLRNELQGKLDDAAKKLQLEAQAAYQSNKSANLKSEVDRILSKEDAAFGDTETRKFLEYLDELNTKEEIDAFIKKLHDKTHISDMGNAGKSLHNKKLCSMTDANYKAVTDKAKAKVAEIERVNANAARSAQEKHDHVIELLSKTDDKGNFKGISTLELKDINEYIASLTDHNKLDDISRALNKNKKIGINERKMIKENIKKQKEAHPMQQKPVESKPKTKENNPVEGNPKPEENNPAGTKQEPVSRPTKAYSDMTESELVAEYNKLVDEINKENSFSKCQEHHRKIREELAPELKKYGYEIDYNDKMKLNKNGEKVADNVNGAEEKPKSAENNEQNVKVEPEPEVKVETEQPKVEMPERPYANHSVEDLIDEYRVCFLSDAKSTPQIKQRMKDIRAELETRGWKLTKENTRDFLFEPVEVKPEPGVKVEPEPEVKVETEQSKVESKQQAPTSTKSYYEMSAEELFKEYKNLKYDNTYRHLSRAEKAQNVKEMNKIEAILKDEGFEIFGNELKPKKNRTLGWTKEVDENGRTVSKTKKRLFKEGSVKKVYDASGNVSKRIYSDKSGNPAIVKEYNDGKLIRETTYNDYDNGYYTTKEYTNDKLSCSKEYHDNKLDTEETYYSNGKTKNKTYYNDDGPYKFEEYLPNGKLCVDQVSNPDGTVSRTRYESDGETPSNTIVFSDADKCLIKEEIIYKQGTKYKETIYARDGKTPIHELTYSSDGKSVVSEVVPPGQGEYTTYEIDNFDNRTVLFDDLKGNITCTSGSHSRMGTTGAAREAGTIHNINNKEIKITYQNGNTYISYMKDKANGEYYVLKFDDAIPESACKNFLEHWNWKNLSFGDGQQKAQQQMNKCINRYRAHNEKIKI